MPIQDLSYRDGYGRLNEVYRTSDGRSFRNRAQAEAAENEWLQTEAGKAATQRTNDLEKLKGQILDQWKQLGVPSIGGGVAIEQRAASLADRLYANQITDINRLRLGTGTRKTQVPSGEEYGQAFVEGEEPVSFLQYDGRQIGFLGNADDGGRNWDPSGYLQPGNLASWTASGKGAVGYTAQAAPNGQVYFVPSWGSTSDVSRVAPLVGLGLSLFAPGLGTAIGSALGATGAAATAIGNAVIGGSLSEASGGDFLQGALSSGLSSAIGQTVSPAISEAVGGGRLGAAIGQGVTSAGIAELQGGDAGQAALLGAVSGAANYVPPDLGMNSPLTMAQIESGLGTEGYGYGAQAAASGLFDPAIIGSQAYPPADLGMNSPITMAQIESGLGTPGYGSGAQAAESGLFDPEVIGSGAYTTAEGFSPVPQVPDVDPYEVGGALGPDNIDVGGGLNPAEMAPAATSADINWGALARGLVGLLSAGAASNAVPSANVSFPSMGTPFRPADTMPMYSPEYYQQVQQYYNTYLPTMPRDVATPLQDWYSSGYEQPDSVTAKLFSGV